MLNTNFGTIQIRRDGQPVDVVAEVHAFGQSLAGCWRARLEGRKGQEISCAVETAEDGLASSGEGYQALEFAGDGRCLTIGAETDREDRIVRTNPKGIAVELLRDGEVVFGIAWVEDHRDGDVRTWLAADPTIH